MARDSIVMVRLDSEELERIKAAAGEVPVSTWLRDLALGRQSSKDWEAAAKMDFGLAAFSAVQAGFGSSWGRMQPKEQYEAIKNEVGRSGSHEW